MSDDVDAHVLRRFELCQKLGKGAYGIVFKAIEKVSVSKILNPRLQHKRSQFKIVAFRVVPVLLRDLVGSLPLKSASMPSGTLPMPKGPSGKSCTSRS